MSVNTFEVDLQGQDLRIGIVQSRFNEEICRGLLNACLGELKRRAESDMKVAFAVYPVDVTDLLKVSDNDMVMPPKSTWFEPKLGSGLFMHRLK